MTSNLDQSVVSGFGDEWSRFDQSRLSADELETMFENYFSIFPWENLTANSVGFDLGCGSGRWAKLVAPRVGKLHLIEPSDAIDVARKNLAEFTNCEFHRSSVDAIPLETGTCDFGYSLGVLHHVPDTERGLSECVQRLKPGAPFLLYLYYRFDNRPVWFRALWKASDFGRRIISKLPHPARFVISQLIATGIYFPLAKVALLVERTGVDPRLIPLSQYRKNSFYTMRTDALDRFGTRLEKRFTKQEILKMMESCGLTNVRFSDRSFWTAVGYKK